MTLLTKLIDGKEYWYYQDNLKTATGNQVISTYISEKEADSQTLSRAKSIALIKHLIKIYKTASLIQSVNYRSEKVSIDNGMMEFIKFCFQTIVKSLPSQELHQFEQEMFARYVHGSTSIEGNTLSLGETEYVLLDDLTPANKPVNEVVEVHNYRRAKQFLDTYNGDINERLIKNLQKIIMNNVPDETGKIVEIGVYRSGSRGVRGVKHSRPDQIKEHINDINTWYDNKTDSNLHPMEIAVVYHHRFEQIHPFHDGNGRVGRAILDLMLKRSNYPMINISKKMRSTYLSALQEADYRNYQPLTDLLVNRILWTFNKLLVKSDIYREIRSKGFEQFFTKLGDSETLQMFKNFLTKIEIDDED